MEVVSNFLELICVMHIWSHMGNQHGRLSLEKLSEGLAQKMSEHCVPEYEVSFF
jgi:hypothetical protein